MNQVGRFYFKFGILFAEEVFIKNEKADSIEISSAFLE
jgi:hypothetical protein